MLDAIDVVRPRPQTPFTSPSLGMAVDRSACSIAFLLSTPPRELVMHLIFFETVVAAITQDGDVLIALFDGSIEHATNPACVALLSCKKETAEALTRSVSSVLNSQPKQFDE